MPAPRLLLSVLLLGALTLTACDRDAPEPPAPDAPIEVEPPADDATGTADPGGDTAGDVDAPTTAGTIDYVALGDSMATGTGAATSYPAELADLLADDTGADIAVTNLAVDGWTSQDLLDALRNDEAMRTAVTDADLVTLDIGGNDLLHALPAYLNGTCGGDDGLQCLHDAADDFAQRWDDLLDAVVDLRDGEAAGVLTLDLYQPFPHDERLGEHLDRLRPSLDAVNAAIHAGAEARDLPVATVFAAFHGPDGLAEPALDGLISVDGLHPSNDGHRRIAEALLPLVPAPNPAG